MTQAFLHNGTAKMEIRLEKLMAAGRSVHDVRCYAVLRHDHCANSFCGRPFFRSGGFGEVPRVYVESIQPRDEQVFLPPPIKVDHGETYSYFLCALVYSSSALNLLLQPPHHPPPPPSLPHTP